MDVFQFKQGGSKSQSRVGRCLAIMTLMSVLSSLSFGFAGVVWAVVFMVMRWLLLRPQPKLLACDELGAACLQYPAGQQVHGQFDQPQRGLCYIRVRFRAGAHEQPSYLCVWLDTLSREERARFARISENIR